MSVGSPEPEGGAKKKLTLEIVTLFPGYFTGMLRESIIGRAITAGLFDIRIVNLREFGLGKHRVVDDTPFGGGGGMVLMLEPLVNCLESIGYRRREKNQPGTLLLTSAAGRPFRQADAVRLSLAERVTIICGHYLGVDERLLELFNIEEVCVGDYVLTGGEPAAAVMVDAIGRLVPGALGDFSSALADSHQEGILGPPVYTRPDEFDGLTVPEELKSGNHALIATYRRKSALRKTAIQRPEMLQKEEVLSELSEDELAFTDEVQRTIHEIDEKKQ